ncbi:hypothetical protein ETC01_15900 [Geobacillus sp. NFOSA3]|uniref:hypothetical protein n=1 Tax=Geobacillus sp. BMUD TaxID=2508876 RepID=UPI0014920DCD|nr:hypothetical protein [Geobacillus sp. BMUD]NNU84763.1 hypothetical protein [Geobacillus sp. BMUD]NNU94624.1 hypothetical protein [Geobacillus sp. NFOSA3]
MNKRLEYIVGEILQEIVHPYGDVTIRACYTNQNCRNINVLQFDYAVLERSNPIALIEAEEKHHFAFPNERAKFHRTVDNRITRLIRINEYIKWKFQVKYCIPIIRVTEAHCTQKEKLLQHLRNKLSIVFYAMRLNIFERYEIFYKEFFLDFGAERLYPHDNDIPEDFKTFIEAYNNNALDKWLEKNFIMIMQNNNTIKEAEK